jgi:hypothetical protein
VAVEEMQHLHLVNEFLVALGGAPNLKPQVRPFQSDVYPFELRLEPLSQKTLAAYLYVEADRCALNLRCPHSREDKEFIRSVLRRLKKPQENHIGSLYGSIMEITRQVAADPPAFLPADLDWNTHRNRMFRIIDQGEEDHFEYFKAVYLGTHPGFGGVPVWDFPPHAPEYPALAFDLTQTTAYAGQPGEIRDPTLRDIAWLSDLHYWIILGLLDVSYRFNRWSMRYKAIGEMTEAFYALGGHLARHNLGLPFDPPPLDNDLGSSEAFSLHILKRFVGEAESLAQRLRPELPPDFNFRVYRDTLAGMP